MVEKIDIAFGGIATKMNLVTQKQIEHGIKIQKSQINGNH